MAWPLSLFPLSQKAKKEAESEEEPESEVGGRRVEVWCCRKKADWRTGALRMHNSTVAVEAQ